MSILALVYYLAALQAAILVSVFATGFVLSYVGSCRVHGFPAPGGYLLVAVAEGLLVAGVYSIEQSYPAALAVFCAAWVLRWFLQLDGRGPLVPGVIAWGFSVAVYLTMFSHWATIT